MRQRLFVEFSYDLYNDILLKRFNSCIAIDVYY